MIVFPLQIASILSIVTFFSFFSLYLNFHKEFSGEGERQVLNDIVDELVALGYLVKENNLYKPTITKKQLYEIFGDDED